MDFDFTPEQTMLRDVTRELLGQYCPASTTRRLYDEPLGYDDALWKQLAETGLLGVTIPESLGGQGLGMIELALIQEEMGRVACPSPYFASVLLAATALQLGGDRQQQERLLPELAAGRLKATLAQLEDSLSWDPGGVQMAASPRGDGFVLSGVKRFVPFAHASDVLIVAARTRQASDPSLGITLLLVDRDSEGLSLTPTVGFDRGSKVSLARFENVRVGRQAVLGQVDEGWPILDAVLRSAAVGAAAEMLGAARKCMELSVEYARVREQFGQPIGTFQAIKHACAEMLVEVEAAHAATYYAAWAQDAQAPDAALAASVAKSYVGDASRKVCGSAIQVHGGIGFTWEYDLHLYFKRAKYLEAMYGDAETHRERVLHDVLAPVNVAVTA